MSNQFELKDIAQRIDTEIRALPVKNTPNLRAIRRSYTAILKDTNPDLILSLAKLLFKSYGYRWLSYELIRNHPEAFKLIDESELRDFGININSWGAVDAFAGLLAGPAWQQGQVSDQLIRRWAFSEDRWWRRIALVCTVVLNRRSCGGKGDVVSTLAICRLLVNDKDDMVVKAMSWALRELIPHDADAVSSFLKEYDDALAARVKREVTNKLTTGRKNPKKKKR